MKAVVVSKFGAEGGVALADVPEPNPGRGEVRIDVEAIEVNYPDVLLVDGRYQIRPALPFILGMGAAGCISAIGAGVSGFSIGQRVAAQMEYGAYAEKVCAPASVCYPVPDTLSSIEATAAVLTYQTAWFALKDRGSLAPGESVLVLGAGGGVGMAAMHLAKALGARQVIAATRGTSKAASLLRGGADHVLDIVKNDLREDLRREIYALTENQGVNIVIDPIGGPAFDAALRCLAWRGRHVVIGFAGGEIPTVKTNYLLLKNISVAGLRGSDYRDRCPSIAAAAQAEIFRFIADGIFRPFVGEVISLSEFDKALAKLRSSQAEGKIVLVTGRCDIALI